MIYEFPVKKEPDPPPVADNGGKMHAAGTVRSAAEENVYKS